MLKILITGARGQVGSKLLTELQPLGQIVATDLANPNVPGLDFHALDLSQAEAISALVRLVRPDIIVNPGAYTAVDQAEKEPDLAHKINAEAVRTLGLEAARLGIPLVHYSTDYVFDGSGDRPWRETDGTGPLSVYGRTKLEGELALAETGCSYIVLRTSWVFSDHGANFVKTMLRLGAERDELRVVNDQIGAPTSAAMLARMTRLVLEKGFKARPGIYHLTASGATSWHGFAEAIFAKARVLGFPLKVKTVVPIPTEAYPTPARRPLNSRLDCTKFVETFGVQPETWEAELDAALQLLIPG